MAGLKLHYVNPEPESIPVTFVSGPNHGQRMMLRNHDSYHVVGPSRPPAFMFATGSPPPEEDGPISKFVYKRADFVVNGRIEHLLIPEDWSTHDSGTLVGRVFDALLNTRMDPDGLPINPR